MSIAIAQTHREGVRLARPFDRRGLSIPSDTLAIPNRCGSAGPFGAPRTATVGSSEKFAVSADFAPSKRFSGGIAAAGVNRWPCFEPPTQISRLNECPREVVGVANRTRGFLDHFLDCRIGGQSSTRIENTTIGCRPIVVTPLAMYTSSAARAQSKGESMPTRSSPTCLRRRNSTRDASRKYFLLCDLRLFCGPECDGHSAKMSRSSEVSDCNGR